VQHFIVPDLSGPPTGGTAYNRRLLQALRRRGCETLASTLESALDPSRARECSHHWVDTLYLERLGELADARPGASVGLIAHYLPSLVRCKTPEPEDLEPAESHALRRARWLLAPSAYMAEQLVRLGVHSGRIGIVEPGVEARSDIGGELQPHSSDRLCTGEDRGSGTVHAVIVANLVEAKGIVTFLRALEGLAEPEDAFELQIIGSHDLDAAYAGACLDFVAGSDRLRRRVRLAGPLPHDRCIAAIDRAHVVISASRMESYGMVLAQARASGVPVLAREGGNVRNHVDPHAGGELVADELQLARSLLALVREQAELRRRRRCALAHPYTRSWDEAATEFLAWTRGQRPPKRSRK
jgi:D-inositol-3-phosphate glycosyltransferase